MNQNFLTGQAYRFFAGGWDSEETSFKNGFGRPWVNASKEGAGAISRLKKSGFSNKDMSNSIASMRLTKANALLDSSVAPEICTSPPDAGQSTGQKYHTPPPIATASTNNTIRFLLIFVLLGADNKTSLQY